MNIAVMGAGGVGGYFGGRLAAAGARVVFIARGAHLDALRRDGLRLESRLGDAELRPVDATDDPAAVGPVDLVLFAVKQYDTGDAIRQCLPLVGEETAVLSLQNGVEGIDQLGLAFGRHRVLGGVAKIAAVIESPGIIRHTGTMARIIFGELDGSEGERVARIGRAFSEAAIDHTISSEIHRELWDKLVFLSTFSGLTSIYRQTAGDLRSAPERRARATECFTEAYAVAQAHGAGLPEDTPARKIRRLDELPFDFCSSMLEDLRRGRRLELPWLSGAIVRLGADKGLATPQHAAICRALESFVNGHSPGTRAPGSGDDGVASG